MSVKHAILILLSQSSRHRYDLKVSFESMVYNQWEINAGQIYTTIDRLVRDGFVDEITEENTDLRIYHLTEKGRNEIDHWLLEPVEKPLLKDDFYFKLLCAKQVDFHNLERMVKEQKESIIRNILELQLLRRKIDITPENETILYLIDGKILHLEADMKWLDMLPN
ncbi:PadR family transcriptional regulator [Rossellomorea marisflavi]|uniref:PadR family transcriptional regulator n=1 Tax=Rossellomorea marisflavi TaxID=189381 RepID=A0A0M0G4Y3_9BACI|nr:PadR family transcriptional regulator [Rossellomorea marisflavi]MBV6682520.1 PadR family transcriptional regulator [Bacillus sp. JRC01]VXC58244.1 PadR family transcriptional regulator [Bacillus sp. 349Y]KON84894.1 PadR family transcriptional regulator [Rossellomorea marisflavi]MCM2588015.1 PadR family transcriptional regulator [Rossellomorea marisflavi]MCM2603379.1 PadR family transcriptional regulator [Rossellomorea marisflavi]